MKTVAFAFLVSVALTPIGLRPSNAQSTTPLEFDVASIRPHPPDGTGPGPLRPRPDGTMTLTNVSARVILTNAMPVTARKTAGLPEWVDREHFDVTVKPPADTRPDQAKQMWQTLLAERMHLAAHVEDREENTFTLVVARDDGRLGPALKPSTLDCGRPARPGTSAPLPENPTLDDFRNRCNMMMKGDTMVSGGMTMDQLARFMSGPSGAIVNNRTGLEGYYSLSLTYSAARRLDVQGLSDPRPGEAPEIFTALEQQLGLKLRAEKSLVPTWIVDHVERPTPN